MQFAMQTELPHPPEKVWQVMIDIARIARCIPGCEQVEELSALERYSAVMKQKIGPFKLEVPADIIVQEHKQPVFVRARASGKDKITRTVLGVDLRVDVEPVADTGSRLMVHAELQVAGRLASIGYAIIKKKAEENFAEFELRFLSELGAI
jgi:carbon monoxide dehydrogenase subunit G